MKTIYKYELKKKAHEGPNVVQLCDTPSRLGFVVHTHQHDAFPTIWVECDSERFDECSELYRGKPRKFYVFGTGWKMDDYVHDSNRLFYVGTTHQHDDDYVWHIYEEM